MSLFRKYQRYLVVSLLLIGFVFSFVEASSRLSRVSDTISTSWPATGANHTVRFTLATAIPASGQIIITPREGFFYTPSLNHNDVRLYINGTERNLAAFPGAGVSGVQVISGLEGRVIITLANDLNTFAGDQVIVQIGLSVPDRQIINPAGTGSYSIKIETFNSFGNLLDSGTAMIAILDPVHVGTDVLREEPIVRTLQAYTSADEPTSAALYGALVNLGSAEWGDNFFQYRIKGVETWSETPKTRSSDPLIFASFLVALQEDITYEFRAGVEWLRWDEDESQFILTTNYGAILEFPREEEDDDEESTDYPPPPPPGVPPPSGVPANPPPEDPLRPPPYLIFEGWGFPNQEVTLLKEGEAFSTATANSNGEFSFRMNEPLEGIFTFTLQTQDSQERRPADVSFTIEADPDKVVRIPDIVFAPTIGINEVAVMPGDNLEVSGISVPNGVIDATIINSKGEEVSRSTVVNSQGEWALNIDTNALEEDRYRIRAKVLVFAEESGYSRVLSFAIGIVCLPADLNCDGSVDLIDFSILMFYWGTSDPRADINGDGVVDVIDFSIMMAYWTG